MLNVREIDTQVVLARTSAERRAFINLVNLYVGRLGHLHEVPADVHALLFKRGGKIVGTSALRRVNGHLAELVYVCIAQDLRTKGLGKSLVATTLALGFLAGHRKVFATINAKNTGMLRIAQACGMVCEGLLKDHYQPGRDVKILSLKT